MLPSDDDRQDRFRRQREYEEVTALLEAVRAAGFDLGDQDADDARLLTRILVAGRERLHRRESFGRTVRWIATAVGAATLAQYGSDIHEWLKSLRL